MKRYTKGGEYLAYFIRTCAVVSGAAFLIIGCQDRTPKYPDEYSASSMLASEGIIVGNYEPQYFLCSSDVNVENSEADAYSGVAFIEAKEGMLEVIFEDLILKIGLEKVSGRDYPFQVTRANALQAHPVYALRSKEKDDAPPASRAAVNGLRSRTNIFRLKGVDNSLA